MNENLQFKLENKKLNMTVESLSNDLTHAKADIEQLFYGIQLLIRGLRPFRVKVKDLLMQKAFLYRQLQYLFLQGDCIGDSVATL
jgi:hypothetical protein